jgi:chorismate mutase
MVMDTNPDDGGQVLLADGVEDCYEAMTRLRAELAQRTAERAALAAEVAALKANDQLAEMWWKLSKYQEQADRDGHGESWRRMCEERTTGVALAASLAATQDAAKAAAWAAAHAQEAIAAIRKAKGVQR